MNSCPHPVWRGPLGVCVTRQPKAHGQQKALTVATHAKRERILVAEHITG